MNSPAAALTWELWIRHRKRLLGSVALLITFALFYPRVCAWLGVNPANPDAISEIAQTLSHRTDNLPSGREIGRIILIMLVALGPIACLFLTLFILIVVFAYTGANPSAPFSFSTRIFTLPVSSSFLATWLMAVGSASLFVAYHAWTLLVPIPYIEVFAGFMDCLPWVTLLLLTQAIAWSLNNFPSTRMSLVAAAFGMVGALNGPAAHDVPFFERNKSLINVTLAVIGILLGHLALRKIRHGAWQTWRWTWRIPSLRPAFSGPAEFRSVAQAQMWFEWRRHMEMMFLAIVALSVVPFVITALVVLFNGPIDEEWQFGLTVFLVAVPLFIHFAYGISPGQRKLAFATSHPITNGEMAMAEMKALALSAVASWLVTLLLLSLVPLLGDLNILREMDIPDEYHGLFWKLSPLIFLGLIFMTWRFGVASLCFTSLKKSWIALVPAAGLYGSMVLVGTLFYLARTPEYRQLLARWLPVVLTCLVVLKFGFAVWTFRHALNRQLLARSSMLKYLVIWMTFAAAFLAPLLYLLHNEPGVLSAALIIILLLPLARIGLYPIALNRVRHG